MIGPGMSMAVHWQAILEVGPDECQRAEAALDALCAAIAVLPTASGWRLEGLLRPDLDPVDVSRDWPCVTVENDGWCPPALRVVPLPDCDWVAASQRHLSPVKLGRFIIHGTHDCSRIRPRRYSIVIDAGQAFGTGHHASSRGCLLALEHVLPWRPVDVFDFGCGSGLLAIAAVRSGCARVVAMDHDPLALAETRRNAVRNHVTQHIRVLSGHRPVMAVSGQSTSRARRAGRAGSGLFDLTLANILADPLVEMAADLTQSIKPGGFLILSGFLDSDHRRIQNTYHAQGLHMFRRVVIEDWITLIMRRGRKR